MFSASLEIVLAIAYREAVSRRHAYVTLEHLLYALAYDPDGERILVACGADLAAAAPRSERVSRRIDTPAARAARSGSPSRRRRSAACCRPRCCTCRARSGRKCRPATSAPPFSSSRRPRRRACSPSRASRGSTCSSTSRTGSRRRRPSAARLPDANEGDQPRRPAAATRARRPSRDPLGAYCVNLTERARQRPARSADRPGRRAAAHDRSPLPPPQEQSGVRRRGRRRQDRDGRRARHAAARRRCAGRAEGRRSLLARHRRAARRHALPRRFRGALQGGDQGARGQAEARFSSSTRSIRRSAPARSPAARWISRR